MHLSFERAIELKNAGLVWNPSLHDFFMIPDTGLDRPFVLTDMMAELAVLKGHQAITFHGAVEWALDYVFKVEAVWLPTEAQLRHELATRLRPSGFLQLRLMPDRYVLEMVVAEAPLTFSAETPADAYANALLTLLNAT